MINELLTLDEVVEETRITSFVTFEKSDTIRT